MNRLLDIPIPDHRSTVPGFDISAVPTAQPDVVADGLVTTSSFIKVDVTAAGTNDFYPGKGTLTIAIMFGYTNGEVHSGRAGKNWMYILGPYTDTILKVELVEKQEDPEYAGVNLVIWSKDMGDRPFYELVIVPNPQSMGHT